MKKKINTNKVETGKRIKNLREEAGYNSQKSFAEKLGYSRQTVAKWENGETMPTLDTLYDIVSVLDCDMGYLLCLYDTRYFKHAEICEETGLSAEAVEKLRIYKDCEFLGVDFIDKFIKSAIGESDEECLLETINNAIWRDCRIDEMMTDELYNIYKSAFSKCIETEKNFFEDEYIGIVEEELASRGHSESVIDEKRVKTANFYCSVIGKNRLSSDKIGLFVLSDSFLDIVKEFSREIQTEE